MSFLVLLYVVAAVAANVAVAVFGPKASILCAFLFIGLSITTRDRLHDQFQHDNLWLFMLGLILTSTVLSYIVIPSAGRIGLASAIAFFFSETTDTVIYQKLHKKPWIIRSNASNVGSALVDSVLFTIIAFASWLPLIVLLQFVAKVGGGFCWSLVLRKKRHALTAYDVFGGESFTHAEYLEGKDND